MASPRGFALDDVFRLIVLLLARIAVRGWRPNQWPALARRLGRIALRARPKRTRAGCARLAAYGTRGRSVSPEQALLGITSTYLEESLLYAGLDRSPDFRPAIEMEGIDDVVADISSGRGVLLWTAPQIMLPLLVRLIGADAGWPLVHLRHWSHGGSGTRFGVRFINPFGMRVEDRYAEHIVISHAGPTAAVREVGRRLTRGAVVQFNGAALAGTPRRLRLFEGEMRLTVGAPRVALRNGAALFGVTASRERAGGGFRVRFERFLDAASPVRALDRDDPRIDACVERFRTSLETALAESPDLWPLHGRQFTPMHPSVAHGDQDKPRRSASPMR